MVAKIAVVVPVGQQRDAVLALVTLAASKVVRLRLAQRARAGPAAAGVAADLDALRGPDPAVDPRGLERGTFATTKITNASARPESVNVS